MKRLSYVFLHELCFGKIFEGEFIQRLKVQVPRIANVTFCARKWKIWPRYMIAKQNVFIMFLCHAPQNDHDSTA